MAKRARAAGIFIAASFELHVITDEPGKHIRAQRHKLKLKKSEMRGQYIQLQTP